MTNGIMECVKCGQPFECGDCPDGNDKCKTATKCFCPKCWAEEVHENTIPESED